MGGAPGRQDHPARHIEATAGSAIARQRIDAHRAGQPNRSHGGPMRQAARS